MTRKPSLARGPYRVVRDEKPPPVDKSTPEAQQKGWMGEKNVTQIRNPQQMLMFGLMSGGDRVFQVGKQVFFGFEMMLKMFQNRIEQNRYFGGRFIRGTPVGKQDVEQRICHIEQLAMLLIDDGIARLIFPAPGNPQR